LFVGRVDAAERVERPVGFGTGAFVRFLGLQIGHLDDRRAVELVIDAGRLAELVRICRGVEDVVTNLEGDADAFGVLPEIVHCRSGRLGRDGTELGGRTEQRARFASGKLRVLLFVGRASGELGGLALAEFHHRPSHRARRIRVR